MVGFSSLRRNISTRKNSYSFGRNSPDGGDLEENTPHGALRRLGAELASIPIHVGHSVSNAVKSFDGIIDALRHGGTNGRGLDDRKMLLEEIIAFLSSIDRSSPLVPLLNDRLITLLWNDLAHPPATFLSLPHPLPSQAQAQAGPSSPSHAGPNETTTTTGLCPFSNTNYPYHTPSGAYNNPFNPVLGAAGCPYGRTVISERPAVALTRALPDAGVVFDVLFARPSFGESGSGVSTFKKHPGGLSSLFFAFANLVIHSLFNTSSTSSSSSPDTDLASASWQTATTNTVSSYLDLSPLYGSSEAEIRSVRRMDGSGRLWEDCWADERIGYMPPSSVAMVIVFCRNHNYIAQMLLAINESGSYVELANLKKEKREKELEKQDTHIYERARLINCHHFMQVIITDYIGAILGITKEGNDFTLDPLREMSESLVPGGPKVPRGVGNVVSAEFNMLYRWHAALSESDVSYTEGLLKQVWPDQDLSTLPPNEFIAKLQTMMKSNPPPRTRPLPPYPPSYPSSHPVPKRLPNGAFPTEVIASILQNATNEAAHAFGARCIPGVMKVVEVIGIEMGRRWGMGSLNEMRRVLGLKEYTSFIDWNHDANVADAAQALYGDIDNLELYPGLMAEATKKPMTGAGLCPGFTISRAILSDAISLVRGDRLLSVERTPGNMTAWGYQDTQLNTTNGAFGGMLSKIIFRTLPGMYEDNSPYALFPFIEPGAMKESLMQARPQVVDLYDWDVPKNIRKESTPEAKLKEVETKPKEGLEEKEKGGRVTRKAVPTENGGAPTVPIREANGSTNGHAHANGTSNGHANGSALGHQNGIINLDGSSSAHGHSREATSGSANEKSYPPLSGSARQNKRRSGSFIDSARRMFNSSISGHSKEATGGSASTAVGLSLPPSAAEPASEPVGDLGQIDGMPNGHANGSPNGDIKAQKKKADAKMALPSPGVLPMVSMNAFVGSVSKDAFGTPTLSLIAMKKLLSGKKSWRNRPDAFSRALGFPEASSALGAWWADMLEKKIRKQSSVFHVPTSDHSSKTMASLNLVKPIAELAVTYISSFWLRLPSHIGAKDFQILYDYVYVYPYQTDRSRGFQLGEAARGAAQSIMNAIRTEMHQPATITHTMKAMMGGKEKREFVSHFMGEFRHKSDEEVANEIFVFLVAVIPIWGQILVNLVASCLGTEDQTVVEELVARSRAGDQGATTTLADKCTGLPSRESPIGRVPRKCQQTLRYSTPSKKDPETIIAGEDVLLDLDGATFSRPLEVKPPPSPEKELPDIPFEEKCDGVYSLLEYGDVLKQLIQETGPRALSAVFSKNNLRLASSSSFQRFRQPSSAWDAKTAPNQNEWMYQGSQGEISLWPQNLEVIFEREDSMR